MSDSQSLIDPNILSKLGTPRSAVPPELVSSIPYKTQQIVRSLEPPKHFEFGMELSVPKR